MFMKFTDSSAVPPTSLYPGFPYGGSGVTVTPNWMKSLEDALFIVEIVLNVFIMIVNVWVCVALWRAVRPEYKACFYIIMRTFNIFVAINALGTLIVTLDRTTTNFEQCWWTQLILLSNMFTCIASSIWLFYAGFNRMMVLVYPRKMISAFECWMVRGTLTVVAVIALLLSVLYQKLCGMYSRYDAMTNTIQVVASDMAEPMTIGVYVFPLFSLIFYAVAYNNLRGKRLLVTSDKTKDIIDKAERKTLKIGMIIMVTYTLSLVVHLFMIFYCTDDSYSMIYNRIDEIVSTFPQISLPLALLSCNHKLFMMKRRSSSVSATQSGTVQDLVTKDTYTHEKKTSKIQMDSKMSTASN